MKQYRILHVRVQLTGLKYFNYNYYIKVYNFYNKDMNTLLNKIILLNCITKLRLNNLIKKKLDMIAIVKILMFRLKINFYLNL